MLTEIARILPRTELNASLYPTNRMKQAVSTLYGHIIKFLQDTLKWYQRSSASRALKAIYNPFELDLKETVERINESSRHVDEIANTAARVELRDLHTKVDKLIQVTLSMIPICRPELSMLRSMC